MHKTDSVKKMYRRYGFFGSLKLIFDLLYTKIFFNEARIIRFPCFIRGIDYISFGKKFTAGICLRIDALPVHNKTVIVIGDNVEVNDYVHIGAIQNVFIGNNVLIGSKVLITDHNHGSYSGNIHVLPEIIPNDRELYSKPVTINDNCWIGESVSILQGVTIGKGSIIGANSVVTENIPENVIACGNPAKIIKKWDSSSRIWVKVSRKK